MRIGGVLFFVVMASVIGGLGGNYVAVRRCDEEIARLTHDRELGLLRERELRTQLEEALTAQAALTQEVQQLQQDFAERLKRLEEIAAQQAPAPREESNPQKEPAQ